MKKEQVIIFEGEHNFVMKKNRVRDKKTGISHYVPDEMYLIAPKDDGQLGDPIEPPADTDGPAPNPKSEVTDKGVPDKNVPDDVKPLPIGGGGDGIARDDSPSPIGLGDARKIVSDEEITTSTTSSTTTKIVVKIDIPTGLGTNPTSSGVGSGASGSSKKETAAAAKKSLLQKYWWVLLLVAGGGAYYYYKKKKK
jgi:hypothetical protein